MVRVNVVFVGQLKSHRTTSKFEADRIISYIYKLKDSDPVTTVVESSHNQIYNAFLDQLLEFEEDEWYLVLFEGSPTENSYSWCSDCVYAQEGVKKFKSSYGGPVKFLQFKVGSKDEWSSGDNPFKMKFPCLTDLPTAVLFRGQVDCMRVIAVQQKDLLYLCERSQEYENQIKSGVWVPPKVKRVEIARSQA